MSDLLDARADQALEAVRSKLLELEEQEQAAIAGGDAAAAVQHRGERLLLEEAAMMLVRRRAEAARPRTVAPAPAIDRGGLTRDRVIVYAIPN